MRPLPSLLRTDRLVLDGWLTDDVGWYADLVAERSAAAARRGEPPTPRTSGRPTAESAAASVRALAATVGTPLPLHPVRVAATGTALGYCGLVVGRSTAAEPELAYEFLEAAHGHGHATEAARAVVDAARTAGYVRLWATIRAWNAPSFAVAARLGFVRDPAATRAHPEPDDGRGEQVWNRLDL
ncbi:GNAT family N-acetyltransferase [Curtobacterium sp. MCPF17_002]|uniref:GNAT family N-acetyltransferase n=1 Tax=Curtobacterium sp. MCPF17_002 TaxID=2175645 RepID=UPI000DA7F199|nr:GNAT family N-acetyltransferase [Curtobacterium sp. MCPF17_002]WIB78242.1 GNAT family N-acetyltransferase [Curtobacterium sp. MCPF17_002]